jgi:hypothetical protein
LAQQRTTSCLNFIIARTLQATISANNEKITQDQLFIELAFCAWATFFGHLTIRERIGPNRVIFRFGINI